MTSVNKVSSCPVLFLCLLFGIILGRVKRMWQQWG